MEYPRHPPLRKEGFPGVRNTYLICLKEPDHEAIRAIGGKWTAHYELNDSQILIATRNNGGGSIHRKVADVLGEHFVALIVRIRIGGFLGRYDTELWEWLERHVGP